MHITLNMFKVLSKYTEPCQNVHWYRSGIPTKLFEQIQGNKQHITLAILSLTLNINLPISLNKFSIFVLLLLTVNTTVIKIIVSG